MTYSAEVILLPFSGNRSMEKGIKKGSCYSEEEKARDR